MNVTILKVAEVCHCKAAALGDDFGTGIVLNTLRHLTLCEFEQLVDENLLQVLTLCIILLVNLGKRNLVLHLALAGLYGTLEEFLVDDDTSERGVCLE